LVHSNDDIHIEKAERSLVRKLCLLNSRKSERDKQGEFLAEGIKICSEILEGNVKVTLVLLSESFLENPVLSRRMVQKAVKKGIRMKRIDDRSFRRISGLKTDQGVLVRAEQPPYRKVEDLTAGDGIVPVADNIQDPFNLGAIIRSAAALGFGTVGLFGACADVYNPKTVRASSGTIHRISFVRIDGRGVDRLRDSGYVVYGASSGKGNSVDIADINEPPGSCLLLFGNEGAGISRELSAVSDKDIHIPISNSVESLNVAVSAGIIMYTMSRLNDRRSK
jgi:TrmH family RNA methyltransferase